jgi:hypothetical protein
LESSRAGAGGVLGAAQVASPRLLENSEQVETVAEDFKDKLLLQAADKNPYFELVIGLQGGLLTMHRQHVNNFSRN